MECTLTSLRPLAKSRRVSATNFGWHHYDVSRAKIESLFRHALAIRRIELQVLLHNLDKSLAQFAERHKLAHVPARQLFSQTGLVAGSERPVREVIGESLANKMEFLQGSEGVLKDRVVRTDAQGLQKLCQRICFLRGNA